MLPKKFRLPPKNFDRVYRNGKKLRGKYGMFVTFKNEVGNPRFAFVVSKKVGGAVLRNRMTRLLRVVVMEIVKEKELEELGMDFQYIAFKFCNSKELLKEDVLSQFQKLLKKELQKAEGI
jgi:ribonuclease P protein component